MTEARRGCYVYAVLPRERVLAPGLAGLADAPLSTVRGGSIAAAISAIDRGGLKPSAEQVLRHEAVIETLRQAGPALPVRFGTVLADPDAVVAALADRQDVLRDDLIRLGDKIELGLTALWDASDLASEADQFIRRAVPAGEGRGARYLRDRLAEYRRTETLRGKARALIGGLDSVLRRHALASRYAILPTPRLAFNATYLLEPAQIESFRSALEDIRRTRRECRFLLSGPWPPYSFVTPPDDPATLPIPWPAEAGFG